MVSKKTKTTSAKKPRSIKMKQIRAMPANYKKGSVETWDNLWLTGKVPWVEDVHDAYDQGQVFEWVKYKYLESIFPKSTKKNIINSLEVGCGSASVSAHFALRGYKATLLDTSDEALKVAKKVFTEKRLKAKYVKGNALNMPFKDNSFDVVMSFGLLEHFEDVQELIDEMVRVLKPGGLFFADIVPKRFNVQTVGDFAINTPLIVAKKCIKGRAHEIKSELRKIHHPPFYENDYSYNQYIQFMKNAQLKDIYMTGNNPFPSIHLTGKLQRLWTKTLIRMLPGWQKFDRSQNWFSNIFWPRAWWAHATKS